MEHTLSLLPTSPYRNGYFVCNLCWEKGSGAVYHCSDCQFDLHPHCAATEEQHTHFSHYQHPLNLTLLPSYKTHICDMCGERVPPKVYRCSDCDYDMHSLCVRAPRFLQHRSHRHALTLMHMGESGLRNVVCNGCGDELKEMTYRCADCNFDLHPSCVLLPIYPLHYKHPAHRLRLLLEPSSGRERYMCQICGLEGRRWVYSCELCSFDLHPQCVKVLHQTAASPSRNADSHEHLDEDDGSSTVAQLLSKQHCSCCSYSSWASEDVFGDVCVICLEGYDKENRRKYTGCGHHFHLNCILEWLEIKDECPICRKKCHVP